MNVSINIPEKELSKLQELADKKGMTLEALLRQSYRVYHDIEIRMEQGSLTTKEFTDLFKNPGPVGCGELG